MQNTEVQEMMLSIIKHAQTAEPMKFRLLRSWSDYSFLRGKRRALKFAVKALERITDRLLKKYCNSVISGKNDFNKLLAYQQIQQVIAFYRRDLTTITSMLDEYEAYLSAGNFLDAFLGATRN